MGPINAREVPAREVSEGDIAFSRRRLAAAAGARRVGLSLYDVPAGARQMPVHVHGDEEEIFYVLGGDGLAWHGDGACSVGAEDVVIQAPRGLPHTFLAGASGLELLAFASGSDTSLTFLPRAGVMWCGPRWVPLDSPHPFRAEGEAGPLERPEPGERPANVVALATLSPGAFPDAEVRTLGAAAGAALAGLNHVRLNPGAPGAPYHCHSLEEELFYVLDGSGTLRIGAQEHPLVPGDVVARPPGTGVAHAITAGDAGLTYLAYGTRVPGDGVYYPDLGKLRLRGLGLTLDVPST